jgi:alkylation response protein AidB-like acyl-CoA dehydrogenase
MTFGPTLTFQPKEERLRMRLRTWLREHAAVLPEDDFAERVKAMVRWQGQLYDAGFVGLSWPTVYGGHGLGLPAEAIFAEELASSAAPELINRLAVYTWGPTLLSFGTEEQKERFLRPMLDATELWCQGFSEPAAGSDLAAVRMSAVADSGSFVLNGQKVWTTRASWAKWCGMLVRTDRTAPRHAGLSVLIVDMHSPGITVRPLLQIGHEPHFSEVFVENVRVPQANAIGAVGDGWRVAMKAMSFERGLFVLERLIRLRKRLEDLARELIRRDLAADAVLDLGCLHAQLEVLRARVYSTLAAQSTESLQPGATSIDKLLLSEADQGLFAAAFDILGPEIAFGRSDWSQDLLASRAVSIYSGTSEIQRNIIASQLLHLPRSI